MEQRHPQRMFRGQKLFPHPLPRAPVDSGGNFCGAVIPPGECVVSILASGRAHCNKNFTELWQVFCIVAVLFFLIGKKIPFPKAINFNQIKNIAEPKKVAYVAVLWVFSMLSLNPSTQLLEELRLGPFKCKLSNLQNMYFGI